MTNSLSIIAVSLSILSPLSALYYGLSVGYPIYLSETTTDNKLSDDLIKYWCIYGGLSVTDNVLGSYISVFPGYNLARILLAFYLVKGNFNNSVVLYDTIKNYIITAPSVSELVETVSSEKIMDVINPYVVTGSNIISQLSSKKND